MYKELVICTIVIVLIIVGNIITQKNTTNIVEEMEIELGVLKEELKKEKVDEEKVKKQMEIAEEKWEEKYETMAYYIEHEELEKVETELTKLKADIEIKEYSTAVENLENCNFILEHIKDKTTLKIVNLF